MAVVSNRLARESSPYLQQHKDNPVDWHPWGEAAFARAREEDLPILLSIGYSSCHWCHVMEEESFEDEEVAEVMNREFVPVKVDREERPDVDSVYMTAVQSMTGQGGWPLTVFLTPEGDPFYGGTYFPPEPRQGMPSFRQVMDAVSKAYRNRRGEVEEAARKLVDALRRSTRGREDGTGSYAPGGREPDEGLLTHAVEVASRRFDGIDGGFGSAPKFPRAPTLDFLLRVSEPDEGDEARPMAVRTLEAMSRGGIRDHLGGGFHRYAVDGRWRVPHFEKMLYDNALLLGLYADAWRATGDEAFRRVARETGQWLLDGLRSPEGGFYSALDADSEGEEGRHYVWDADEIDAVLDPEDAALVRRVYGVRDDGNWEGTNVLHLRETPEEVARDEGEDPDEARRRLGRARDRLLERRRKREAPFRDEKVVAAWNGLAIRALAEAGAALGRPEFVAGARDAAAFVLDALRPEGRLRRSWKDGDARVPAFLEDYAAVGTGLLALHGVTLEPRWLDEARRLLDQLMERFWSPEEGILYDAPEGGGEGGPGPVVRPRDPTDNPTPSGTSLAVELLVRGAVVFGEEGWRARAREILVREAGAMERYPLAFGALLGCLDLHLRGPVEVAVVGPPGAPETRALLDTVHGSWLPRRIVVGGDPGAGDRPSLPLLEGRGALGGRPTAYVCREYACREPVTDPASLESQLRQAYI